MIPPDKAAEMVTRLKKAIREIESVGNDLQKYHHKTEVQKVGGYLLSHLFDIDHNARWLERNI